MTPKAPVTKEKTDILDFMKTKKLFESKNGNPGRKARKAPKGESSGNVSCRAHPAGSSSLFPPTSPQTSAASSLPTPLQKVKAAPAEQHLPPTPDVRTRPPPRETPHNGIAAPGPEPAAAPVPAPGPPHTNKKESRRTGDCLQRPRPGLRLPPHPPLWTGTPKPARPRMGRGAPPRKLTPPARLGAARGAERSPLRKGRRRNALRPAAPSPPGFPLLVPAPGTPRERPPSPPGLLTEAAETRSPPPVTGSDF
ncbi:unnamed protein product [Rangifer tarandus platyrhynchus]|uniref:Uncharacterized protein n=2 Tax=Rangifer tarandus platyrhynchus TaxID=3082113 RepID=A0ABN8Y490_RANTA|nr:unnamed protein product [Rangifer tarandus platyrhynchus]CAI9692855.1 unnamed protein product [Rangifer tarandus platyrhynchus]